MKKRTLSFLLALMMCLSLLPMTALAAEPVAHASTQTVLVDGEPVELQAYALLDENGYPTNYVKLRDIAYLLNGTSAQFDVGWDGSVNVVTGKSYTPNGSEMKTPFSGNRIYTSNHAVTKINGTPAVLDSITLTDDNGGGYTYYKLRDLGAALGFMVDWTAERGIYLETRNVPEAYDLSAPDDFLETIAAFAGVVTEGNVPEAELDALLSLPNDPYKGITFRKLTVNGTPLYEAFYDDGVVRPLVFILHGGGGHKDLEEAAGYARCGFRAVAIDCAGHGESLLGPLAAPAAFAQTVQDIDQLIEYYNTLENVDATRFGLDGSSMGGNIAYCYAAHGKYKPTAIVAKSASPDLPNIGDDPLFDCFGNEQGGKRNPWSEQEIRDFAVAYSPLQYPERFVDIYLYAGNGMDDPITPCTGAQQLEAALTALGGEKFDFHYFENVGHGVGKYINSEEFMKEALLDGRAQK